jgi:hypothetical protein
VLMIVDGNSDAGYCTSHGTSDWYGLMLMVL